jgi:anti-sigma factor RsiW
MRCDHYQIRISAYVDNELPSDERLVMEEHLKTCPSCAGEVETLRHLGVLVGRIPDVSPSLSFVQTTVNSAASIPQHSRWSERYLNPVLSFLKSAAAFLFAPDGYGASGRTNLSLRGYLRTFDDSPPGSFADVYLTVTHGGSN